MNRTRVTQALRDLGLAGLADGYTAFYLSSWDYFLLPLVVGLLPVRVHQLRRRTHGDPSSRTGADGERGGRAAVACGESRRIGGTVETRMPHPLTEIEAIDVAIEPYLRQVGEVFQAFRQQDSGTVSYGVLVGGRRWFVKESDNPSIVESLRRALHLHTKVQHTALPRLYNSFRTPGGLALVYEWVPGEVLHDPRFTREQRRLDPAHPHVRFRSLPVGEIVDALDTIFDAHVLLADAGFVASDFYDGCIIYDFVGRRVYLCDLDEYRHGPFVLDMDRNYGSTRFMAPEEFRHGSTLDQVTNVFSLGRAATVLLGDGTESLDAWRGSDALRGVVVRATSAERSQRHQSVREFVEDWREAVGAG